MTNANTLRRLNWLWKHRHTHDDDDFDGRITIIEREIEEIEEDAGAAGSGAYVHLERAATQSIGTTTEAIEWDQLNAAHTPFEFSVTLPVTEVEIRKPGYYDIEVAFALDSAYDGGGSVTVLRNGAQVWPPSVDTDIWVTTNSRRFAGVAKGIECSTGDKISVEVNHNSGSAVDLDWGQLSIELVDRIHASAGQTKEASVTEVVYSEENTDVTTHTISMTSAQTSGDLLLMFLVANGSWSAYPSGWTTLVDSFYFNGGDGAYMSVLYKVSDGTEADVTADTATADTSAHIVWVVSSDVDYSTTAPEVGTSVNGGFTSTVDPPAVTPSHGAGDYLVFPLVANTRGQRTVEDHPDGYALLKYDGINDVSDVACGVWEATVAITTSEDPSSVTVSHVSGIEMGANTVAVKV